MIQDNQVNTLRSIPEVFDRVKNEKTKEEKVKKLAMYKNRHLRWFINALYNVDWSDMPVPDYKPSNRPPEISHLGIGKAIPRIEQAYRQRYNRPDITERLLLLVLEEMSAAESELLVKAFTGKRKIDGVSKHVFREVYPDLFRFPEKDQGNNNENESEV